MGLINSYWGVILPLSAFGIPFAVYVLTDYIRLISQEIFDSATIDGCGRFQTFVRIVLPLLITPVQTVFAIQFIGVWNEYLLPLLVLQDKDKYLIPTILATFKLGLTTMDYGLAFAAIVISSFPAILIFTFLNRSFVKGLTAGAVKE
jgi:raffinose/stachyose/melibiose transport system permease protein